MSIGTAGSLPFGWIGIGSSGGGDGGTGDIKMVMGVCGQAGGPVAGATTWTPSGAVLVGATQVWVAIVNNVPENSIASAPDFTFNSGGGSINRAPDQWVAGDTIILWYKPA